MPTYRCAICEREVTYDGPLPQLYPFCSDRCQMVDLGRWFRENYSIDRDFNSEDAEAGDPPIGGTPPPTPPK